VPSHAAFPVELPPAVYAVRPGWRPGTSDGTLARTKNAPQGGGRTTRSERNPANVRERKTTVVQRRSTRLRERWHRSMGGTGRSVSHPKPPSTPSPLSTTRAQRTKGGNGDRTYLRWARTRSQLCPDGALDVRNGIPPHGNMTCAASPSGAALANFPPIENAGARRRSIGDLSGFTAATPPVLRACCACRSCFRASLVASFWAWRCFRALRRFFAWGKCNEGCWEGWGSQGCCVHGQQTCRMLSATASGSWCGRASRLAAARALATRATRSRLLRALGSSTTPARAPCMACRMSKAMGSRALESLAMLLPSSGALQKVAQC